MRPQPFLHDRLQRLAQALETSSSALRELAEDPTADVAVEQTLTRAAEAYAALGLAAAENEVLALHAELAGARRGLFPSLASPPTTYRRAAVRAVAMRVLLRCADRLRTDVVDHQQQLARAREEVATLLVYALQHGLLVLADLPTDPAERATETWRRLGDLPETQHTARHLTTRISRHDAVLLLVDVLASWDRTSAPAGSG